MDAVHPTYQRTPRAKAVKITKVQVNDWPFVTTRMREADLEHFRTPWLKQSGSPAACRNSTSGQTLALRGKQLLTSRGMETDRL